MQFLVCLGSHVNSKLFFVDKDSCETAMKRILHDFRKWNAISEATDVNDPDGSSIFEIRDDYDGYTVMRFADFRGFILNSSEGNEAVQIEVNVANKTMEFKTQLRLQSISDNMVVPAKRMPN